MSIKKFKGYANVNHNKFFYTIIILEITYVINAKLLFNNFKSF